MRKFSIEAAARQQTEAAAASPSGHAAGTIFGGHEHVLRQTVVGLKPGAMLGEYESPGEATLHVLRGRVTLRAGGEAWEGRPGDLLILPDTKHSIEAQEESAVLLTVAKTKTP